MHYTLLYTTCMCVYVYTQTCNMFQMRGRRARSQSCSNVQLRILQLQLFYSVCHYSLFLVNSVFVLSPSLSLSLILFITQQSRPKHVRHSSSPLSPLGGWCSRARAVSLFVCKWARKLVSRAYTHIFIYRPGPTIIFIRTL